jgi:hypothetical protein
MMNDIRRRAESEDLVVVALAGHAGIGRDGMARFFLHSVQAEGHEYLAAPESSAFLTSIKAKYFAAFLDVTFGRIRDWRLK